MERLLAEGAVGACRGDDALDEGRHRVRGELARAHADDGTPWIDGDERGPRAHGVRAPNPELTIVQDGMRRPEANGCVANARRLPLGDVLTAVHTDDGDGPGEPLLELPQLRKHMDAVDSAVGPEVEEQHLAAEIGEREAPTAGVQPVEGVGEIWSADGGRGEPVGHGDPGASTASVRAREQQRSRTTCTNWWPAPAEPAKVASRDLL